MKIGIVTRKDGYNIGSSLQAYAIQQTILDLGYNGEIIDYCEYSLKARVKYFLLDIPGYLSKYLLHKTQIYAEFLQRQKFKHFEQTFNKSATRYFYSIKKDINALYDCFICGSDQIWNPLQYRQAFLLDFVTDEKLKIAYAPSLGIVNESLKLPNKANEFLKRFDYLSCRELAGKEYLEKSLNRTCHLVLDPTLLIEKNKWEALEVNLELPSQKYILCYFLGRDNFPSEYIYKLSQEKGLAIINIRMFYVQKQRNCTNIEASPEEFLYLMHHAEIVCTNSYHGSIFSIIYHKLFYIFYRKYQIKSYNESSRFESLFSILELNIPILNPEESHIPYNDIDYMNIDENLNRNREKSKEYLRNALQ